jgi:RND superfamily putative drug exporter
VLAFGIFVDAIIIRMIFVPAALQLLGTKAWAFPKWLEWLPEMDVEGHGIERELE